MELSRQATEKRKYSTLDTECFSWLISRLSIDRNDPVKKKNFEFKYFTHYYTPF